MVTINPPNKSIDTTALANIYRGFSGGDYDECDACDWVLSNAEAILNTHDALRNLITAAAPITKRYEEAGSGDYLEDVAPDTEEMNALIAATSAAKEVIGK